MRFPILIAGAAALLFAGSANAITITNNQGLESDGDAVAANRSDVASLTDGDTSTFFSLGIGGSITASIAPDLIASASALEITNGNNSNFPESAEVFLGVDATGLLLGEIFNSASGGTTTSANGATITATANDPGTGLTSFLIDLGVNSGSALTFVDTTAINFGPLPDNRDGFDIAELTINAVPVPAALPLFATALIGVGLMSRRRRKTS